MKLSTQEKIAYGLGDTASNFIWALMMNFIMFFYTDIFGITAAAAGTMLLFARFTDGFWDEILTRGQVQAVLRRLAQLRALM